MLIGEQTIVTHNISAAGGFPKIAERLLALLGVLGNGVGDSPAVALTISWLTARICSLSHLMFAIAIGKKTTMSCHRSPNFANTTPNQVYVTRIRRLIRYRKKKLTLLHQSILCTVLTQSNCTVQKLITN